MSKQLEIIEYYDRSTGRLCQEKVLGDIAIKWAYQTFSGKIFSFFLFETSLFSRIIGWYFDSSFSKRKISSLIEHLDINVAEFARPQSDYKSFNDFFTRKLKKDVRPYNDDNNAFLSPADGRLLVYNDIVNNTKVQVKGVEDSLNNLFNRELDDFNGGKIAVVRLCPADYHRFHFPCNGTVIEQVNVKGKYHSVNPIALDSKKKIFCMNKRSYTIIDTKQFGRIAYMEIGAFGVAGIHQTFSGTRVDRMEEKGYFDFGGSTIVLVFQKNSIEFDYDLLENSTKGIETFVKAGETIAKAALVNM